MTPQWQTRTSYTNRGFTICQSDKTYKIWDAVLTEAGKWLQGEFGAGGIRAPLALTPPPL